MSGTERVTPPHKKKTNVSNNSNNNMEMVSHIPGKNTNVARDVQIPTTPQNREEKKMSEV